MQILIDADGCPVTDIAVALARQYAIPCLILCDTAHYFERSGATTLVFDKGADSVDFALVERVNPGDIVITQDYGLASMAMAKGATVLHQDGWPYTPWNIDALLLQRHEARKYRAARGRFKGPKKRTREQDTAFEAALRPLLQNRSHG